VGVSLQPARIEQLAGNRKNNTTAILLKILEKQDLSETDRTLDVALNLGMNLGMNPETIPEISSYHTGSALDVVVA